MSSSAVRQGGVYIEIGADPRKFFAAVGKVNARIGQMGRQLASAGSGLGGVGLGMVAPFAASVAAGTKFQDTLLNIRASTGATAQSIATVRDSSMQMSQALGIGPTEAAQGMLELMKAGMELPDVLAGAGKAALQFAKVGGIDVPTAAVVMNDAMNVFGVSAEEAANTISAAADSSSTSIASMSESFAMSSAVAALAGQNIVDLSASLAILANNGVKGSDAGTSVKTMLLRLMAPADEAIGAMTQLGLTVDSFRGADGKMLPMVEIIRTLNGALGNMDRTARDDIFRRMFGSDAIRAAAILTETGVDGFGAMTKKMMEALPVSEKFKILMSGMAGAAIALLGALERLSIAVSDAIGPAIAKTVPILRGFIDGITNFVTKNPKAVELVYNIAAGAIAAGAAMAVAGSAISVASSAVGTLLAVTGAVIAPIGMLGTSIAAAGGAFSSVIPGLIAGSQAAGVAMISFGTSAVSSMTAAGAVTIRAMSAAGSAVAGFAASAFTPLIRFGGALQGVFMSQFAIARFVGKSMTGAFTTAFSKMLMSVGPLRAAFTQLSSLALAIGSDVVRAVAPIGAAIAPVASGFYDAIRAVGGWAAATAAATGQYIARVGAAVAATVVAKAQLVAAWAAELIAPVIAWATATATQVGRYIASLAAATGATIVSGARMAGVWLASLAPATAAWAASAAGSIGRYIASTIAAAAATVANAARIAVAWVASGLPGLGAFVAGSVAALGTYLGAAAAAVAGSVASATAIAAAWLAPAAPILAIVGAIGLAGAAAYAFSGTIRNALSGIGELAGQAGAMIGETFSAIVADAMIVFGDLWKTATITFTGISEAITNGDLSGAMDVLWAGLQAGWLRGVEALMGYVDPWIAAFQNTFTYLGTEIAATWDTLWTSIAGTFNTFGAYLQGAFDNIINPILASWDVLEAGVRKAWIRISGIFKNAEEKKAALDGVDAEMAGRAEQRAKDRPGISGRVAQAEKENAQASKDSEERTRAMRENADATAQSRLDENEQRKADRRAETVAAESRVAGLSQSQTETRQGRKTGDTLIDQLDSASSMDELRTIAAMIHDLNARGLLTAEQKTQYDDKIDAATERVQQSESGKPTDAAKDAADRGAADAAQSKTEVAGTFSASAAIGMGFGTSLQERIAKASEQTAASTSQMAAEGGGRFS
jgi:TP901 family phage tail tape measure protein